MGRYVVEALADVKKQLRREVAARAACLDASYLKESDAGIRRRLLALDVLRRARTVFCYVSVRNEPDTHALIEQLLQRGKVVCVPCTLPGGEMDARHIDSLGALREKRLGLLEPDDAQPLVPPADMDVVLLPCVACDRQGNRLGHGGGYYDRYLAKTNCPTVCLCREALLLPQVPMATLDKPVDVVVSEAACYPPAAVWAACGDGTV